MADRVAVMRAGRLEQCAAPAELYGRPATAFVAEFVGTMSRIPGRLDSGVAEVLGQRLPVDGDAPAATEIDVLVRPEAVRVRADEAGTARVVATAFLGAATRVTVRLPDATEVKADLPTHEAVGLGSGAAVTVSLPERPVLVAERTQ
jgi:putative spermidine/putrescine transport system ATP-binding protein